MSILAAYLVALATVVLGLPSGAPPDACSTNLAPLHGSHQASPYASPYSVSASADSYTAGKSITVTIKAPSGKKFKGYLVQAQDSNTGSPLKYGSWSGSSTKELPCAAVTHTSASGKSKVELTWTPTYGDGDVTFVATIVEDYSTFYTDVKARVHGSSSSASSSSSNFGDSDSDSDRDSDAYEDLESVAKPTSYPFSNRRPSYRPSSSNSYPSHSKHSSSSSHQNDEYGGDFENQRHHQSPSSFHGSSSGGGFGSDPYAAYRAYQQSQSSQFSDSSNTDHGEDKQESVDTFYSAYPQASSSLYSHQQPYHQFPRHYPQFH